MAKGVYYITTSVLQPACRATWLSFAPQRNHSYVSSQENNHLTPANRLQQTLEVM